MRDFATIVGSWGVLLLMWRYPALQLVGLAITGALILRRPKKPEGNHHEPL